VTDRTRPHPPSELVILLRKTASLRPELPLRWPHGCHIAEPRTPRHATDRATAAALGQLFHVKHAAPAG
jgi:hypothetical protein